MRKQKKLDLKTAGVYIDGANILHGSLDAGWKVDYEKLRKYLRERYKIKSLIYYNSIGYERGSKGQFLYDENGQLQINRSQEKFYDFLKGVGYRTVVKNLKFINNDFSKPKNNMDTYLTVDILEESDLWQTLILFSGDCDFDRLIEIIMGRQKNIVIYSFKSRLSYELKIKGVHYPNVIFCLIDDLRKELEYLG
jgi:uncharacterized LabA/DUF88 family protein